MESELVKESVVRGHLIYKEVWSPVVGELLPFLQESINVHDRRAVFRDVNIVGHAPRELSRIFWFFLNCICHLTDSGTTVKHALIVLSARCDYYPESTVLGLHTNKHCYSMYNLSTSRRRRGRAK